MNKDALKRLRKAQRNYSPDNVAFDLAKYCGDHLKQYAFCNSLAKRIVAACSRRAGKSTGEAGRLVLKAIDHKKSDVYYICSTKDDAEAIMWEPIIEILDNIYGEGNYKTHLTKLLITLPNKSRIKITGCPDVASIKKFLGRAYSHVTIDECQDFQPELLKRLINKAIIPALIDFQGSLAMIGTPALIHAGPFYEAFHNVGKFKGWEQHSWTMKDNPWLERKAKKTAKEILQDELDRRELEEPDAEMKREFLGLWVQGDDELVYRYNPNKNTYEVLPNGEYTFVLGVDLGFVDETAFALVAYSKFDPNLYLVEDFAKSGMDITAVAEKIKYYAKRYDLSKVVIDSATGGANWVEEVNKRYGIYAVSADKQDKEGHIKIFNDCLGRGNIKTLGDAGVIKEWMKLGWRTSMATGKRREDPNLANHRSDAFLYAQRDCYQYMWKPAPDLVEEGSDEWLSQRFANKAHQESTRMGSRKPRHGTNKRRRG